MLGSFECFEVATFVGVLSSRVLSYLHGYLDGICSMHMYVYMTYME